MEDLIKRIEQLEEWKSAKEKQQINFPVDEASKISLGAAFGDGLGSTTLTEDLSLTGNAQSITVPAPYAGSVFIVVDGVRYEIPFIATA